MNAFVFPGQGSQIVGMGKALAEEFSVAKETFAQADAALGEKLSALCWNGPDEKLALTENAQPAILAHSIAVWRAFNGKAEAAFVAGHSLGEYSALVCAGALHFADAVRLVKKRGELMQAAVPAGVGAMAAVMGMSAEQVAEVCKDAALGRVLCAANLNGASQIVISGHADAIERAIALVEERKGAAKKLNVSAPFHSPLMQPAADGLAEALAAVHFHDARVPVICNVDALPHTKAEELRALLIAQVTAPVRWEECTQKLVTLGATRVIEFGADTLVKLTKRIAPQLQRTPLRAAADLNTFA